MIKLFIMSLLVTLGHSLFGDIQGDVVPGVGVNVSCIGKFSDNIQTLLVGITSTNPSEIVSYIYYLNISENPLSTFNKPLRSTFSLYLKYQFPSLGEIYSIAGFEGRVYFTVRDSGAIYFIDNSYDLYGPVQELCVKEDLHFNCTQFTSTPGIFARKNELLIADTSSNRIFSASLYDPIMKEIGSVPSSPVGVCANSTHIIVISETAVWVFNETKFDLISGSFNESGNITFTTDRYSARYSNLRDCDADNDDRIYISDTANGKIMRIENLEVIEMFDFEMSSGIKRIDHYTFGSSPVGSFRFSQSKVIIYSNSSTDPPTLPRTASPVTPSPSNTELIADVRRLTISFRDIPTTTGTINPDIESIIRDAVCAKNPSCFFEAKDNPIQTSHSNTYYYPSLIIPIALVVIMMNDDDVNDIVVL
eukprot:TRINITY_DN4757_c0_g1_i1.p1 TRINITY_DN4757_c0_g1~~TRINITY_DN4757_c0_g1_i1.p1  ORF type:complete len:420 (-),score=32.17 TRINITY_DN4757_c0_g1_i1:28-1287(-)